MNELFVLFLFIGGGLPLPLSSSVPLLLITFVITLFAIIIIAVVTTTSPFPHFSHTALRHLADARVCQRAPGAAEPAVVAAVERVIARHGGREAHGRATQPSHAMLDNEIREQYVLGTVLPSIFLLVAAFLLNVVVSRLVAAQREQIAALKALGYPGMAIGGYYLKLVLAIVAVGAVLGLLLGGVVVAPLAAWLARRVPARPMMAVVGLVVCAVSLFNLLR